MYDLCCLNGSCSHQGKTCLAFSGSYSAIVQKYILANTDVRQLDVAGFATSARFFDNLVAPLLLTQNAE
jgi:hypothetical protein